MKKRSILCLVIALIWSFQSFAQYTEADIYTYIDSYKELAINKMYEHKIPASITIAQGIFESAAGKSHLAVDGNNHFGIKCHKDWTGDTILIDDDELQECFRKYEKVEDSYNDHSLFLKNRSRYKALFDLDIMDYPGWARGLKAAGYATNPAYADRLISLIQRYKLADLDTAYQTRLANGYFANYPDVHPELAQAEQPASASTGVKAPASKPASAQPAASEKPAKKPAKPVHKPSQPAEKPAAAPSEAPASKPAETAPAAETAADMAEEVATRDEKPTAITVFAASENEYKKVKDYPFTERQVYENNKTLFVIAQKGDSYAKIARDVQSSEARLKKYNDVSGSAKLKVGQVVYIERKNNAGPTEFYQVVNAESMHYISQKFAVKLAKLLKYNSLIDTKKLKKGQTIKLKR